jgi:hypothetical protein
MDGEAVVAPAHWARPDQLCAGALQLDATPGDFIFDPYGAGALDIGGGDHAAPRNLSAIAPSQPSCFGVDWPSQCALIFALVVRGRAVQQDGPD